MKYSSAILSFFVSNRDGDYEFSVMCAAQGKPKPSITWLKGTKEVSNKLFDTSTDESESELNKKYFLCKECMKYH